MPNVFTPRADLVLRALLGSVAAILVAGGAAFTVRAQPGFSPRYAEVTPQPVMFSHEHHVGRLGMDCRYCHTSVARSGFAGMPTAATCMNCHLELYTTAPMLEPVREAWESGVPLAWNRVCRLPDHVHFNHRVHVNNGVACVSCHGRMDEQPLTSLETPMTMGWYLDCHREPERQLVDQEQVFDPEAAPGSRTKPSSDDLNDPEPIPRDTDFASLIESDVPIIVQHTRLDSRQSENALMTTTAFHQ